jgi:glycosyltransferase involved in cell wall biosynthesis
LKLELFGPEKLCQPITLEDLTPDDLECLEHGHFQLLNSRDRAGRAVCPVPGDVFLALGASWHGNNYLKLVESLKQRFGVRFAFMVHDLIPVLWPEYVVSSIREPYLAWLTPMLRAADVVFTNSEATTADVLDFAAQAGIVVPAPKIVPIGVTFRKRTPLPSPLLRPYVLMVSTIEIRKNHALMLKVWRRLIA